MIFDVLIIIILLYGAIRGFKRGFSRTIFSVIGWLISVLGAFIATPFVKEYLLQNTNYYDKLMPSDVTFSSVPHIVENNITQITVNLLFTVAVFAICFIVLKILMWLIIALITKGDRKSLTGMVDGFFGMIFGFLKSAIIACIFIACILPLTEIFAPNITGSLETLLNSSYIAKLLYDNNPIYLLLKGFFIG